MLEKSKLPRLNKKEREIMNHPITSTEMNLWSKISQKTKAQDQMASQENSIKQTFREELMPILLKTLLKNCRGRNTSKLILQGRITLIPKPDKNNTQKENHRPISLMNTDAKILNKILPNRTQQHIKKLIYHDQVGFIPGMQGFFNIR